MAIAPIANPATKRRSHFPRNGSHCSIVIRIPTDETLRPYAKLTSRVIWFNSTVVNVYVVGYSDG